MIPIAVGAVALAGVGVGNPSVVKAEDQMKVEITSKDDGYGVKGHTTPDALTRIVVRNEGTMTHGISSPHLKDGIINWEGEWLENPTLGLTQFSDLRFVRSLPHSHSVKDYDVPPVLPQITEPHKNPQFKVPPEWRQMELGCPVLEAVW